MGRQCRFTIKIVKMRGLNMTYQTNKVCESTFGSREATYPYYNKDCDKYTVKLDFNEGGSILTFGTTPYLML
jgi:hypothetical protein